MLNRRLYKGINDLFIFKLYLLFCRMNVHINLGWIKINEEDIHRETVGTNHFLVGSHHRMIQVGTSDKPVVDEEVLITAGLLSSFWFADKPGDVQVISFFLDTNQL